MPVHPRSIEGRLAAAERILQQLQTAVRAEERRAYRFVQADGVDMPQHDTINFIGIDVTDNPGEGRTDVG